MLFFIFAVQLFAYEVHLHPRNEIPLTFLPDYSVNLMPERKQ